MQISLHVARQRILELESRQHELDGAGADLKSARARFEYLLTFSPAIIYTTQASGTYVSENIRSIMGFSPQRDDHRRQVLARSAPPRRYRAQLAKPWHPS